MLTVLYEVGAQFDTAIFVPLFMFVAVLCVQKRKNEELTVATKIALRVISCILLVVFLVGCGFQIRMYTTVTNAYRNGEHQIVEGYVENFVPATWHGNKTESFDINGVHFSYSENKVMTGYHDVKDNDGVITGNGQYLKIGYVYYNDLYGNIIVYIEELEVDGHT